MIAHAKFIKSAFAGALIVYSFLLAIGTCTWAYLASHEGEVYAFAPFPMLFEASWFSGGAFLGFTYPGGLCYESSSKPTLAGLFIVHLVSFLLVFFVNCLFGRLVTRYLLATVIEVIFFLVLIQVGMLIWLFLSG